MRVNCCGCVSQLQDAMKTWPVQIREISIQVMVLAKASVVSGGDDGGGGRGTWCLCWWREMMLVFSGGKENSLLVKDKVHGVMLERTGLDGVGGRFVVMMVLMGKVGG